MIEIRGETRPAAPNLRAGLAGITPHMVSEPPRAIGANDVPRGHVACGRALLERAIAIVDYARQQRIEFATDIMKGLPTLLARRSWAQSLVDTEATPSATAAQMEASDHETRA